MKRFIVSEEHRIELHDLVSQEMERQMTSLSKLSMSQPGLTLDQIFERVQRYERALDILGPIIAQGCYWGSGGQAKLSATALERTAELARIAGGMTLSSAAANVPNVHAALSGRAECDCCESL